MKYSCYNSFVLALLLLLLHILLIWPSTAKAQSVKLSLFATDSLTEENVTGFCVYIDDTILYHSLDETNVAHIVLDNAKDNTFRIRVHKSHYYDRIIDVKVGKNTSDTAIHVKMNYVFSEPQLPIFFFDSASVCPDTNFNPIYTDPVLWLGKIQKANDFKSNIWIEADERRINAKSLLGVLSMAVVPGTEVIISADGSDETEAVKTLSSVLDKDLF